MYTVIWYGSPLEVEIGYMAAPRATLLLVWTKPGHVRSKQPVVFEESTCYMHMNKTNIEVSQIKSNNFITRVVVSLLWKFLFTERAYSSNNLQSDNFVSHFNLQMLNYQIIASISTKVPLDTARARAFDVPNILIQFLN